MYVLLLFCIVLFIILYNNTEHFDNATDEIAKKEFVYEGAKLTDDALFKDLIIYDNDGTLDGELGIEKCSKNCKGNCVEYGVSGIGWCFPV
uniref:Uncharacterized protein n=1 Tax=viral metagenome TaxID=1070528 RepID=A0A6C0EEQ8_9ZZZZ